VIEMASYDQEQGVETIHCHYIECTERLIVASDSEIYELRRYERPEFEALAEVSGFTVVNAVHNALNGDNAIFTLMPNRTVIRAP